MLLPQKVTCEFRSNLLEALVWLLILATLNLAPNFVQVSLDVNIRRFSSYFV